MLLHPNEKSRWTLAPTRHNGIVACPSVAEMAFIFLAFSTKTPSLLCTFTSNQIEYNFTYSTLFQFKSLGDMNILEFINYPPTQDQLTGSEVLNAWVRMTLNINNQAKSFCHFGRSILRFPSKQIFGWVYV